MLHLNSLALQAGADLALLKARKARNQQASRDKKRKLAYLHAVELGAPPLDVPLEWHADVDKAMSMTVSETAGRPTSEELGAASPHCAVDTVMRAPLTLVRTSTHACEHECTREGVGLHRSLFAKEARLIPHRRRRWNGISNQY